MSFHFSQALEAAYSEPACLVSAQSVPLKTTPMPSPCSSGGKTMDACRHSRSGMTSPRLTECRGADVLDSFLAVFPASVSARQHLDATALTTFGRRCGESWQMSLPGTSSPKTSARTPLKRRQRTAGLWVTKPERYPLVRTTWVVTTFGADIGFLHTPTTKANYAAASMQKWASARAFVQVFGKPSPANQEWMMGYPDGWTDTAPLGMGKFRSWQRLHFTNSHSATEGDAA